MAQGKANAMVCRNEALFTTSMATSLKQFRPGNDKWSNWKAVL